MVLFTPTNNPFFPFNNTLHDSFTLFTLSPKCGTRGKSFSSEPSAACTVQPRHTFRSTKNGIQLEAELPGVAKEHVTVEIKDRKMFVTGKRFKRSVEDACLEGNTGVETQDKEGEDKKNDNLDKLPTPTVVYALSVELKEQVDIASVTAESLQDGVLTIWMPFKKPETRRIEIA